MKLSDYFVVILLFLFVAVMGVWSASMAIHLLLHPIRRTAIEQIQWLVVLAFWGIAALGFLYLPWLWVRLTLGNFLSGLRTKLAFDKTTHAIARLAESSSRTLSESEAEKVRGLLAQGTEDGLRLAVVTLESLSPTEADLASVFTPAVLQLLAEKTGPTCWPLVTGACRSVVPCLDVFAVYLAKHLETDTVFPFLDTGYMGHVHPNPAWQEAYRSLLVNEYPRDFIKRLAPLIQQKITMNNLNMNMIASYYVYAFPFEVLTALPEESAKLLADIPVQKKSQLPAPPFWEPYGSHLTLSGLTELSDDAAAALSRAQRAVLFGGLRSFPNAPGHVQLAKRLARQKHVVLGSSTVVAPAIAEILSAVTISDPSTLHDILYCELETEQDRNRKIFVSLGGGVPNILR